MARSSSDVEPTLDGSTYLAQAETNIINNNFLEALSSLRSAQPSIKHESDESTATSDMRRYMQLQALCRIELASTSAIKTNNALESWWQVFGLENHEPSSTTNCKTTTATATTATATTAAVKDINRQYKRLAILIHPDKCSLPCAQNTFKKLQQGMEALIESLECSERARKKPKQSEDDEKEEKEFSEGEEEFAWWTTWDNPYADGSSSESEGQEAQLKKKEEEEKDITMLCGLDSRQLAKEVRVRQDAMLSRPPPGCTMQDMKTTLLRARKILNAKLEEEKKVQSNNGGGGGGGGFLFL